MAQTVSTAIYHAYEETQHQHSFYSPLTMAFSILYTIICKTSRFDVCHRTDFVFVPSGSQSCHVKIGIGNHFECSMARGCEKTPLQRVLDCSSLIKNGALNTADALLNIVQPGLHVLEIAC